MRASRLRSTVVATVAATFAVPASAQVTSSAEVRAQASSHEDSRDWQGASVMGAALRLDRPRWSVASSGALISDADRWHGSGSFSALMLSPALGPVQLSATGLLARAYRDGITHNVISGQGRASLRFGRWGAWAGLDARRVDGTEVPNVNAWPVIGAWQQIGSALVSLQLSPRRARVPGGFSVSTVTIRDSIFNDTLGRWEPYDHPGHTDSTRMSVAHSWSDAEARLVWAGGRWSVDAMLGARLASTNMANSTWAQLNGLYVLTSRFALIAGAGSQPGDPVLGWDRQTFATLGVRMLGAPEPRALLPAEVRPGPADFRLVALRGDEYLIRIRVPHARTVELSADFTAWKPIELMRTSADWWQANVSIAPGTHHVNIRVNGESWKAPPGTPAVEDEFNGTVGLVVVQ